MFARDALSDPSTPPPPPPGIASGPRGEDRGRFVSDREAEEFRRWKIDQVSRGRFWKGFWVGAVVVGLLATWMGFSAGYSAGWEDAVAEMQALCRQWSEDPTNECQ